MTINRNISELHPKFRGVTQRIAHELLRAYEAGETQTNFEIYETLRSFDRQHYFIAKGVSETIPREHPLCNGVAARFVPLVRVDGPGNMWAWDWDIDHDWGFLKSTVDKFGMWIDTHWCADTIVHPDWINGVHYQQDIEATSLTTLA